MLIFTSAFGPWFFDELLSHLTTKVVVVVGRRTTTLRKMKGVARGLLIIEDLGKNKKSTILYILRNAKSYAAHDPQQLKSYPVLRSF